jgi:ribose transport system permease protein
MRPEENKMSTNTRVKAFFGDKRIPILIALIILCMFFSIFTTTFFSVGNLIDIMMAVSTIGIVSIGATFIVIVGGIDLTPGPAVAFIGVVGASLLIKNVPVPLAIVMFLITGAAIGLLIGLSITRIRLSPFVTTLAMASILRGLSMFYTQGRTVHGTPESFNYIGAGSVFKIPVGEGELLSVPVPVIMVILLYIAAHFLLKKTVFGHRVYAIGGNRQAAYLAGINVKKVETIVYVIAGTLYGVASMVLTGRLSAAVPNAAQGLELNAVAAVVIGGASLAGGKGSMLGTMIGVLIIGVLNNGLNLMNVSSFLTQFIQGTAIFIAVTIDAVGNRKKAL